ncbi:MAG: glutamine--fructose-6-phosphate aminotransferase, partial [Ruminiclostridium sp.]
MCGIVGYVGDSACEKILVDALKKLEYRGYDSAGIAVFEEDRIKTVKAKGKIAEGLEVKLSETGELKAVAGIGHTRWATHGEPSDINSHPIGNGRVSIVHNGIIENYRKIKEFLISKGYGFESETDT